MNTISFMSANYVARQVNYNMTGGWGEGDRTTNEYFRPIETFGERFETILTDIKALGFDTLDLWNAHLSPTWATPEHISIAQELLRKYNLKVMSIAGWFGSTPEEFEASCNLAVALGAEILGGSTSMVQKDRAFVVAALQRHNLRLGLENHPEKTPEEMLAKIGDGADGRIGTTVDTGWYGTQGYDAAQALAELSEHLIYVHLKDVLAPGAHDTCGYGEGIVPIKECVQTLRRIGYTGGISVEHEPEHSDPSQDCKAGLHMLRAWLAENEEQTA